MKFTQFGRYYLYLVLALILAAINTRTNLMHFFTGFLTMLLVLSLVLIYVNLKAISLRIEMPGECFAENALTLRYLIGNHSSYHKFALEVSDSVIDHSFGIASLQSQTTIAVYHHRVCMHRGEYCWRHLTIKSGFPFYFLEKEFKVPVEHALLVLPKPLQCQSLPLPSRASMFSIGSFSTITRTASQEFAGLRDYHPGDSLKSIHWKATAKCERLTVREYEQELPAEVSIVMDDFPLSADGDELALFEDAVTVTASLVWEISHQGYLILFAQGDNLIAYGRGEAHALKILRTLARAQIGQQGEMAALALRQVPRGTTVIFIFRRWRSETETLLTQLRRDGNYLIAVEMANRPTTKSLPGIMVLSPSILKRGQSISFKKAL